MRKLFFAALIIACAAPLAAAQTAGGSDYNKYDFYAGFSHDRVDIGGGREGFNGVEAAAVRNFSRYFGVKGDYSFHHKRVGGVEIKDNAKEKKLKPFAHAMVGFQNAIFSPGGSRFTSSENGFAAIFGGGLDFRVSPRVDIRAVQFDYNPTRFGGTTQNNFRVGVGVVFR